MSDPLEGSGVLNLLRRYLRQLSRCSSRDDSDFTGWFNVCAFARVGTSTRPLSTGFGPARTISTTRLIPILRDSSEKFTEFGQNIAIPNTADAERRFAKLMPRHKPSADDCAKAKRILFSIGMNVENRGFDPTMN